MSVLFRITVYPFLWLISIMPFPLLYLFSELLKFLVQYVIRYRIDIIRANLKNSFPEKTTAELRKIENKFYRHLTDLILETIKGLSISQATLKKRMKLDQPDFFKQQIEKQRSTIVVMSHCGNWEWVCLAAQITIDQHAQCVYKTLSSPDWDAWFFNLRSRFGTVPFPMEKTMRIMTSNSHIITATAFIGDQNPASGKNVYWTQFLHQETCFMQGSEKIARKLDHDVVYMSIKKNKRGFYSCYIDVLTTDPKSTKDGEITELIVKATEKDIISQPQYWLWSHRRWKHKKED